MAWSTPGLASRLLLSALARAGGACAGALSPYTTSSTHPTIGLFAALGGQQVRW